jgi:pimeloyl-ACP methyl ester carboxylesterase
MKNKTMMLTLAVTMIVGLMSAVCQPAFCDPIEATYAANGPYATASQSATGFRIYYPRNMVGNHPIITWGNGTGTPTMVYAPFLNHLASWGFVVVASNSVMTQSGRQMIAGVDYLIQQNNRPGSNFYNMIDTEHIGTTGHSQGGGGSINAATDRRVTCAAPVAPSPGRIGQVDGPVFLVAGRRDSIVSAALVRSTSYAPANGPTVFGIVNNMGHLNFIGNLGNARGYITAWFMYHLQGDEYAGRAFVGECEICRNNSWQIDTKNFP